MKVRPSKTKGKVVVELNPTDEPRIAETLFSNLRRRPTVRFKKILATTDLSEVSMQAVQYAISLAGELGASLSLVHVVRPSVSLAGMESVAIAADDSEIVELERRHLTQVAKEISKSGRPIKPIVLYGKPFREIASLAKQDNFDLIVTGTRGHTGLRRALLGSTAEWVVRYAPCPVLTVPAHAESQTDVSSLRNILVPIDFSETSTKALPYAATLAAKFKAVVTLIHVTESPPPPGGFDYMPSATMEARVRQSAEDLLSRVQEEAFGEEVYTEALVRHGVPFNEITKAASRLKSDLIILTTHGHTGLKHALLGSTAERVVRHARCPVLTVRDKSNSVD